ncbi:hypothetical protein C1752_02145 [Acaryochloris thomasi RCC1774]|uniref:Sulfotransferase domain-containing protein n=1 Tax=Acaryochloris thomasi RCC1774 TaxID=1764569 RepID=A0A2W1JJE4_9CYAN|nr:sulfotransferase domain-containing protein [Acaryochloris thomasi]PZD73548.1 hypothetical protein C1752_02145 [Acaryochloris thomasi RCC1774]
MHLISKISNKALKQVRAARAQKPMVGFVIAGTQKGGTTALDSFLRQHPAVCMPANVKETHFFYEDQHFEGLNHLFGPAYSHYHKYFVPSPQTKIVGEASPSYMWYEKAPERMYKYNPALKVILILRNPVERAFSHWNMATMRESESFDFFEAIRTERERARPKQNRTISYIERGFYVAQIRRIQRFFPDSQIKIFLSEDLRLSHQETLQKIYEFLEISPASVPPQKIVHERTYAKKISEESVSYLRKIFEPEIKHLELIIDRDLSAWLA